MSSKPPCKYIPNCTNPNCKFWHPINKSIVKFNKKPQSFNHKPQSFNHKPQGFKHKPQGFNQGFNQNPRNGNCKNGVLCERKGCSFSHPPEHYLILGRKKDIKEAKQRLNDLEQQFLGLTHSSNTWNKMSESMTGKLKKSIIEAKTRVQEAEYRLHQSISSIH